MTPAVRVTADLRLRVDGFDAHLSGSGSTLRVDTTHPAEFYARLPRTDRRIAAQRTARLLDESGLTLEITDGRSVVVSLGRGRPSLAGRVLAGSEHVRPGRPAVLARFAWATVRAALRRRRRH